MEQSFLKRPIAITDLEMTGLDPAQHEIIEMGLVLVGQPNLEVIDTLDLKVHPEHPETAEPEALKVNGYRPEDWQDAVPLTEALEQYAAKTAGAVFAAYNITYDWGFLERAFKKTGVKHTMDYHRIDIPSIAWAFMRQRGVQHVRLSVLSRYFGLHEEPLPHRAINGAMAAYEVLKKLVTLTQEA